MLNWLWERFMPWRRVQTPHGELLIRPASPRMAAIFEADARRLRARCSKCSTPRRDPEQEHPGICVCGGYITDE